MSGFETIAAGIGFTEGPLRQGPDAVLVTSMSRGLLYRAFLDGSEPEVAAETGGGPNGLAAGADGAVIVAQNGGLTIESRSPRPTRAGIQLVRGGAVEDLDGGPFGAPNDLVVGPEGLLWFTDSATEPPAVRTLDLATGELRDAIADISFPNGLAFSAAGDLYVADSIGDQVLRYAVADGAVGTGERFCDCADGNPDGIAFDAAGNLYVAQFEADEITVYAPDGEVAERLPTGNASRPTNCCFAGPGLETLVVTAASGGRVLAAGGFAGRAP